MDRNHGSSLSSRSPSSMRSRSYGVEDERRWCHCGLRSFLQVARTESNYGRRFFSCPNYKGGTKCNFFVWKDQQFGDQAEFVISELCVEKERLRKQIELMKMKQIDNHDFEEEAESWSKNELEKNVQNDTFQQKEEKLKDLKRKLKTKEEKLQCLEMELREKEEKLRVREEIVMKREGKCIKAFVISFLVVFFLMVLVLNV